MGRGMVLMIPRAELSQFISWHFVPCRTQQAWEHQARAQQQRCETETESKIVPCSFLGDCAAETSLMEKVRDEQLPGAHCDGKYFPLSSACVNGSNYLGLTYGTLTYSCNCNAVKHQQNLEVEYFAGAASPMTQ